MLVYSKNPSWHDTIECLLHHSRRCLVLLRDIMLINTAYCTLVTCNLVKVNGLGFCQILCIVQSYPLYCSVQPSSLLSLYCNMNSSGNVSVLTIISSVKRLLIVINNFLTSLLCALFNSSVNLSLKHACSCLLCLTAWCAWCLVLLDTQGFE